MWLLDSNPWICYMNPAPSPVKAKLRFGAYKSQRVAQNLALLTTLFA